jgi:hypothetical protein
MKPDGGCRQCHEENAEHLDEFEDVLMVVLLIEMAAFLLLLRKMDRMRLDFMKMRRGFVGDGHDLS